MKPFSGLWTKNLPADQAKEFEALVRNSTRVLTRLKEIFEEREREILAQERAVDDFSDPNWSHKQAARNGRLTELQGLKTLIPF